MERNKVLTGILLIAVVLVWGIIVLKVIRGGRTAEVPVVEDMPKMPVNSEQKDSLRLDYRDPFLGEFIKIKQDKKMQLPQVKVARKEPEQPPVPDFTFKGLIGNGTGQRAMILKNGSLHILGPGEMIGEFKVIRISPEQMTVQSGKYRIEVKVR